jgi:hypothetical protein
MTPSQTHPQLPTWTVRLLLGISVLSVVACSSTPSVAPATTGVPPQPYLGGYGPTDPPRMSVNQNPETSNTQLAETISVPFLSFLIIEPDPVVKNAIPTHIEKLIKERKFADAIKAIDAALVKSPRNVQLRFLKARLQIELRDPVSAKNTWIEITQQFPELPEPYNNLAALSANQGKWIEARDYLELALKLRPDYVTAQGNLAEVYLRLSEMNYQSASKLQPNQREYGLRAKAIKEILNPVAKPINKPSSVTPKP